MKFYLGALVAFMINALWYLSIVVEELFYRQDPIPHTPEDEKIKEKESN